MRVKRASVVAVLVATSYGALLGFVLPFEGFKDRVNYLNYATYPWLILQRYYHQGVVALWSNEPLWLLINAGLKKCFAPVAVVRVIIFTSAFLTTVALFRVARRKHSHLSVLRLWPWLFLFLIHPQIIGNFIVHIREGLAMAVFLTGWASQRSKIRWVYMGLAPFIHAAFFVVLLIYFTVSFLRVARLSPRGRIFFVLVEGGLVGSSLKYLVHLLQARQAFEYRFHMTKVSGFGFLFWLMILALMYWEHRNFLRQHVFEASSIAFYLTTYFLIEVTARIFEATLPVVLLSGLELTRWRKRVFLILTVLFVFAAYALRISEPRLGFGVQ